MKIKKIFTRRIVLALISIIIALVLAFIALPKLIEKKEDTANILIFNDAYEKGVKIDENMVSFKELGSYNQFDVFYKKEDVIGKYLKIESVKGEIIMPDKLSLKPVILDDYLLDIPDDKYAMSISIQSFSRGLSAKLMPNDIISVVGVSEEELISEEKGAYKKEIKGEISPHLEYLKILAVTYPTGVDQKEDDKKSEDKLDENKMPVTLSLLVDKKQAVLLAALEENGVIHAILKYRGVNFDKYVIKQDELNKKVIEFESLIFSEKLNEIYKLSHEEENKDEKKPDDNKKDTNDKIKDTDKN